MRGQRPHQATLHSRTRTEDRTQITRDWHGKTVSRISGGQGRGGYQSGQVTIHFTDGSALGVVADTVHYDQYSSTSALSFKEQTPEEIAEEARLAEILRNKHEEADKLLVQARLSKAVRSSLRSDLDGDVLILADWSVKARIEMQDRGARRVYRIESKGTPWISQGRGRPRSNWLNKKQASELLGKIFV